MKRYFIWIRYLGTNYSGWQIQPNAPTVQEAVEQALNWALQKNDIRVVGCGRTDAGVHASCYALHLDLDQTIEQGVLRRLNRILFPDIEVLSVQAVDDSLHARFSATKRTYKYLIDLEHPLFSQACVYSYPYPTKDLNVDLLHEAAALIMEYETFFPFCKSKSDASHYKCLIYKSKWELLHDRFLIYTVEANRFLRGMVRLIVGMCLQVGEGKISIEQLRTALNSQKRLSKPYSVPPTGLFLYDVKYGAHNIKYPASDVLFFPI